MRELLDPLTRVGGVRLASIISPDGVPVAVLEREGRAAVFVDRSRDDAVKLAGQRIDPTSFGALATGWAGELERAVGQISWDRPWRIVLVASQGTLVVQQGPGALVLVVLDPGTPPETIAIPLDGAVSRMERLLRSLGQQVETLETPSLVESASGHDAPAAVHIDLQDDPGSSGSDLDLESTYQRLPSGDLPEES